MGEVNSNLIDTMLELPYLEDDLWITAAKNFDQIISKIDLVGKCILDIGAGRCWSTRRLMAYGAKYAMALDILREEFIGLRTADVFIRRDESYFDRVIGDMNDLPLRKGIFDIVFFDCNIT